MMATTREVTPDALTVDPRIAVALNGASVRVPSPWALDELVEGDLLCGGLVEKRKNTLVVSAVAGATLAGEPLEVGSWWVLPELQRLAVVQKFLRLHDPPVGSFVAVRYRGRGRARNGRNREWIFDCGHTVYEPPLEANPWAT
jgi:hypothetical protein